MSVLRASEKDSQTFQSKGTPAELLPPPPKGETEEADISQKIEFLLLGHFEKCSYPTHATVMELEKETGLTEKTIIAWFEKKRAFISLLEGIDGKRADGADASVLFFLLGCANFWAVYALIR